MILITIPLNFLSGELFMFILLGPPPKGKKSRNKQTELYQNKKDFAY